MPEKRTRETHRRTRSAIRIFSVQSNSKEATTLDFFNFAQFKSLDFFNFRRFKTLDNFKLVLFRPLTKKGKSKKRPYFQRFAFALLEWERYAYFQGIV